MKDENMESKPDIQRRVQAPKTWPKVAIIILNWNGWRDTIECLKSLQRLTYPSYRIILVDNGSIDDSVEKIKAWVQMKTSNQESVALISTEENLGFAGGNNVGIRRAFQDECDYILLLNNDTVVNKSFLTRMVERAEERKQAEIIGCKVYYASEPKRIWYAGGRLNVIRPGGRSYGRGKLDYGQYEREREISFVTGAVMLVKRAVFLEVGLLDESFFFGMEDYDFCRRALRAGYRLLYVPEAVVWHKIGASRERGIVNVYSGYKTSIIYMKKNLLRFLWLPWFFLYSMYVFVISTYRIARKEDIIDKKMYRIAVLRAIKEGFLDNKIDSCDLKNIHELFKKV